MDVKTTPQRAVVKGEVVAVRPVRQLSRRDTQREAQQNPKVFVDRWHSGPLADVPDKRLMHMGPKLFTEAHEDLLRRMRLEGARVSQGMAEAQREATLNHERHVKTWEKLHKTRAELKECQAALAACRDELAAAQDVLTDMDAAWAHSQQHRMSRIMAIDKGKGRADEMPPRADTPDLFPVALSFAELDGTPSYR